MQRIHLLAITGGIAVTFVILFWLQYRQEKQLKEFRIRQSRIELGLLEIEQSMSLLAASRPRRSRGNGNVKSTETVPSNNENTDNEVVSDDKTNVLSDEMRREIEYIENELNTMERILDDDISRTSFAKMVNKYADNTLVDIGQLSNISDDADAVDDSEDVEDAYNTDSTDNTEEDDEDDAVVQAEEPSTNETDSIIVASSEPIVKDLSENPIEYDEFDNDDDICSSEMEIIIRSTQNDLATNTTRDSHHIVEDHSHDMDASISSHSSQSTRFFEKEIEHWMNQYKLSDLKDMCRREGLTQYGVKRDLLERLIHKGVISNQTSA
jgi:hypothetical protein